MKDKKKQWSAKDFLLDFSIPSPISPKYSLQQALKSFEEAKKSAFQPEEFKTLWSESNVQAIRSIKDALEKIGKSKKRKETSEFKTPHIVFLPLTESNLVELRQWLTNHSQNLRYLCTSWLQPNMFRTGSLCAQTHLPITNEISERIWENEFKQAGGFIALLLFSGNLHGIATLYLDQELKVARIHLFCTNNGMLLEKQRASILLENAIEDWALTKGMKQLIAIEVLPYAERFWYQRGFRYARITREGFQWGSLSVPFCDLDARRVFSKGIGLLMGKHL